MKVIFLTSFVAFASGQFTLVPPVFRGGGGNLRKILKKPVTNLLPNVDLQLGLHADLEQKPRREQEETLAREWTEFKTLFNKSYPTPEDDRFRTEVFIENRKKITRFNQDYSFGLSSFVLQVNSLADLLTHEFNTLLNGFGIGRTDIERPKRTPSTYIPSINTVLPESIDWRTLGAVTPVKAQVSCRGCYAFSAAGALEGHHYRKTGVLLDLSPQNLIDCTYEYGNIGCNGGYVDEAFAYVQDNPGIDVEPSYPYEGRTSDCKFKQEFARANVTGFVQIPEGDEEALAIAVATQGPVSVAIDASLSTFQFYKGGVYYDQNCKNEGASLNHAVLVIGYGVEGDGTKYWLVKNSYGTQWGDGGFVKMLKDANNHCGIATSALYPLV